MYFEIKFLLQKYDLKHCKYLYWNWYWTVAVEVVVVVVLVVVVVVAVVVVVEVVSVLVRSSVREATSSSIALAGDFV